MSTDRTEVKITGGGEVVRALSANGVDLVFGIPGTHNLEIYRHLVSSGIRHVTPRHEQGGGYAADAFARACGRPGVVVTTSGPGLTNVLTAAATAHADSVPMLLIAPGPPRGTERADVGLLHELRDQHALMSAAVEGSVRIGSIHEIASTIGEIFTRWRTHVRPRPWYIEIPVDVLEESVDVIRQVQPEVEWPEGYAEESDIALAGQLLGSSRRTLIVAGSGARGAARGLAKLAEALSAPVITTVNGKGVLPESHPLSLGASIRLDTAHRLIAEAETVVVVGTSLGDSELWGHTVERAVIRIDRDASRAGKNAPSAVSLIGHESDVLRRLVSALPEDTAAEPWPLGSIRAAISRDVDRDGSFYSELHRVLRETLPESAIIVGDSAQVSYFGTAHYWVAHHPGQFLYPVGFATLGYGIPGGIGAALGCPHASVVVLAGDGGTMFSIQEFATAVDLELSLPVIVINNGGFREIKEAMLARDMAPMAVDIRKPDFALLAQALGGHGVHLNGLAGFETELRRALRRSGPTLIELTL